MDGLDGQRRTVGSRLWCCLLELGQEMKPVGAGRDALAQFLFCNIPLCALLSCNLSLHLTELDKEFVCTHCGL
jgi:hypothetical protein